jgi:hypothetical protein
MSDGLLDGLHWIDGPRLSESALAEGLAGLEAALLAMNLAKLLATLTRLVPEYQPSEYLLKQAATAVAT